MTITRCQYKWGEGVGPQVNKFKHVSSDNHQKSLAGVGVRPGSEGIQRGSVCLGWVYSGVRRWGWGVQGKGMSRGREWVPLGGWYPMMHVMLPTSSTPVDRHDCKNTTVPQLLMRHPEGTSIGSDNCNFLKVSDFNGSL